MTTARSAPRCRRPQPNPRGHRRRHHPAPPLRDRPDPQSDPGVPARHGDVRRRLSRLGAALGAAARAFTGQSGDLVVAASTLAVAAAFQPVRRRTRAFVDRWFDRTHYDAALTIDRFGWTLRDEVDTGAIVSGLRDTVGATMGATTVGVVLLGESR